MINLQPFATAMMTMTSLSRSFVLLTMLGTGLSYGALYSFTGLNVAIPDANPVGVATAGTVGAAPGDAVGSITVSLTVSGGYNGDLYASLIAPDGSTAVVLLNQPGVTPGDPFGYAGAGLNVTLDDTATTGIQTTPEPAGVIFTGTYQPAGELAGFYEVPVNGTWTLFMADLSTGGHATLTGWSLDITPVPEPSAATALLAGLGAFVLIRRRSAARR